MTATAIASTPTAASWTGTQPTAPARADRAHPKYAALYRFAAAITAFNFIGHTVLGFEQAWLHPFVALAAAYATELLLEGVDAWSKGRAPRWQGDGVMGLVRFLLPAHISAMAVSMLLYSNATFLPIAFAAAVAIASKYVFRMTYGGRLRHFLNPSNFGITVTLVTFHWVGIAAPYMFTENLYGWQNWILPVVIVCSGSFLNTRFTKKMPLIFAWLGAFALQAGVRHVAFDTPLYGALMPMTGVAFILFTFYMVSDPSTTPRSTRGQIIFGASVALVYGLLLLTHTVFTLFFALTIVCFLHAGVRLTQEALLRRQEATEGAGRVSLPEPALGLAGSAGAAFSTQDVAPLRVSEPETDNGSI